ncbi:MAG: hypothetical protein Q4C24_02425 [Candidatus Saccharibacteria bacterium]|uniref:tRNA nuclease CdiA C-terminal domain-containing protein n=1 Tax=Candidatus Nanosyncoccus alces TaxID=2171997 RepID=A0ABY0FM29_9BACT|nr:hypothetical protein [Candidatus Nanosyncoccus alces]MDO4399124.1 hypothetical protein [Candidatus Saccharibacteria bacterium]RYC74871.1 hypothetical protein G3RUM_00420 [Candidatus Nanosyncoccus alces]
MQNKRKTGIFIAPGRKPWPHELRVAEILSLAGHYVEFLEEGNLHTADIKLDGIEYEIKSPKSANANSLEHLLKKALRQSPNIIIDTSRMKNSRDDNIRKFLVSQIKSRKQIKKLIMITKRGQIIDIFALI